MTSAGFPDAPEIPLLGGDVTEGVVRIGDTVRRPRGGSSELVAALLQRLEAAGFDGAPRYLGVDDQQRDVLTFEHGEVAGRPWPDWVADDDRAASVARLVRRYDDAALSLGLNDWPTTNITPDIPGAPASESPAPAFVGHMDVTPENVVFRDGQAAALIDFDLARPVARLDELCNVLLWWAPLMPPEDREPVMRDLDPGSRARMILDEYGLPVDERAGILPLMINSAQRSWHSMKWRAETYGGGWQRMWDEGVGDKIRNRERWLTDGFEALDRAIR